MKTKYFIIIFLLFSLVLKSQSNRVDKKPTYFHLEIPEEFVLDSLNIPYLSIQERNGVNGYGEKIEIDEIKMSKFIEFFDDNEFVFTPNINTPYVKIDAFFRNYVFLTEYDKLYFSLLERFGLDIIGSSTIELKESMSEYKTIQIVEYRYTTTNIYSTMVFLVDENYTMKIIH
jgi:hypothetical protein